MNKRLPLLFLGLLMCFAASAQEIITGKVTSAENGEAVPGVTVTVQGTSTATQTDPEGNYEIAASEGQVLVFSFLGLQSVERTVGTSGTINVSMVPDAEALEEVVVVGYGTQERANLTGAVATIDVQENLEGRPIADVGRAIQGTTPGLSVVVPSGEVGSDPIIKIRGQIASLRGGASPLILLDNVEIPSIQLVNPLDIKSITVLKDAASSSIYGAKAAFGVVLITTKDGQGLQGTHVSYSNNFSFQNAAKEIDMAELNALKYGVDAYKRVGATSTGAFYKIDSLSYVKALEWQQKYGGSIGMDDPTVYGRDWYFDPARNWKFGLRTYDPYEAMIREWAPTQQHNLSVSGREGKTSYNIGLGLLDQSGMMKPAKTDEFSRYNASVRVKSEINKYFTARAGVLYSRRNKEYPYITSSTTADPWLYLYRWSPLYPLGNDENGDPIRSPASEAAAANTANIMHDYVNVNVGGTVDITDNWKVDFDYAFSNQKYNTHRPGTKYTARNSWVSPQARLDEDGNQVYVNSAGEVVPASDEGAMPAYDLGMETYTADGANPDHIYENSINFNRHTINAYTTYNLALTEDHDFKFMLGLNRVTDDLTSHYTRVTNLTDIVNPQFNYGIGEWTGGGDATWESQLGYFGRINYDFRNKYLLEANLRYDGSSKFPTDLKWRWFPSFSAGWVISEEEFMAGTERVLNLLKFRGSWGTIGDQTVPNSLYVPTMGTGQSDWIGGNGALLSTVGTPTAVSSSITWQDITTLNLGLNARLFDNRFGVTFDWYQRNTENMIVPIEGIPSTFGTGAPETNLGALETKGWEIAVDFNHLFDNGLGIYFSANLSDAKTTITSYGTAKSVDGWYAGKTYGEIWGYRTDRLYQEDDFELDADENPILITLTEAESELYAGDQAYKLKGSNPVYQTYLQNSAEFYFGPGDVKFVDVNGDGEINAGARQIDDHGDLEVIGNFTPRYEYGFRFGADYKGIDFGIFFQGVGKREVWGNGSLAIAGYHTSDGAMPSAIVDDYWTPENTDAFYPAAFNNGGSNNANNMHVQSRYLLDMSYLRIKNITLGYSFPSSLLEQIRVNSARIYVALENFVTWDNLNGLPIDPEAINGYSMFNDENYNLSRTGVGTPMFKSVSFGVQLNF